MKPMNRSMGRNSHVSDKAVGVAAGSSCDPDSMGGNLSDSFSAILFDLLAGIIFMVTLAGLMFGVCTGIEALKMLAVSFAIFIIPQIAEWLIERIVDLNYGLRDFIKS